MTTKHFVVTGVSSGIGACVAQKLKEQGHRVTGLDIQPTDLPVDSFVSIDLSDPASVKAAAAKVPDDIDGLCNNAGLPPKAGLEVKILQVNYFGLRQLTHLLLPRLRPDASIVNLASRAGHGWPDSIEQIKHLNRAEGSAALQAFVESENIDPTRAYNLSKEAEILWTKAETDFLIEKGLRMNSVSPGAVETSILQDFKNAFGERVEKTIERAGRAGSPMEIAGVICYLLGPDSTWIKGTDVTIDGGMAGFIGSDQLGLAELSMLKS